MPSGTGHFTGSSKRVEAHPKSSNLVVNSVSLSRDLPVFTGFFEIIRVVENNCECKYGFVILYATNIISTPIFIAHHSK